MVKHEVFGLNFIICFIFIFSRDLFYRILPGKSIEVHIKRNNIWERGVEYIMNCLREELKNQKSQIAKNSDFWGGNR